MVGIAAVVAMVGILLVQTTAIEAEEDLQAQVTQLTSQVKVLSDRLQQEVSGIQTQLNLIQQRSENPNLQSEPKRSYFQDVIDKVQRHGSSELLTPNRRHSRSTDPLEVAFTVKLSHVLNNVPIHTTLRFDHLTWWTGNSYDTSTGVFTCPTSGLYLFAAFIETHSVDTPAVVHLMLNGKGYMSVISERSDAGEDDTGGNVVLLPVNKGDRVWIETYDQDNQSFWPFFTTFSGVLIQRH